ncbi:MAG: N-acetyltransferase [Spirochaetales bacterium]|nr:N-acetyltransferase [Spirochaetales bacterium]
MKTQIRHERPDDYRIVEEVTRDAFWNLYFPGCDEHVCIGKLRQSRDFLPELTFVMEGDGKILGSIFYSRSKIICADRLEIPTVTFGPVSIHPDYHRQGLGRKLITHSIEEARKQGHRAIIIMGYPYHYEPYGFKGGKRYGISMPDGKYYAGLQALPLYDGALDGINGFVLFSEAFEVSPEETEEYDRAFPFKEKRVQPSQKEFEIASTLIDES